MSSVEMVIVTNPVAGRGKARLLADQVAAVVRRAGHAAEVAFTHGTGDAKRLAAEAVANGARVVAGCGGDGTLQEIASSLAGTDCALGFVPVGRCNDLARAVGVTAKDRVERLAANLMCNRRRTIDLGMYRFRAASGQLGEPRYFCTVATMGFDSAVSRFVEQHRLPIKGTAAYLYGVIRVLSKYECPRVRVRGDFGELDERILLIATGNTPFYGGAMQIAPGAKLDDGLFHVCIVREVPKRTVLGILPRVFSGRHVDHPAVTVFQTKRLELETPDAPEWICADGETLGQTPAVLEVAAQVLHVQSPNLIQNCH
jgi:diacylglycerol kinase (ATP)